MSDININMLILGQTGSGKSTLINYIYGKKVVETGMGLPVTSKGDFTRVKIQSPLKPSITHTFYDSWGLESNKAEEWKKIIKEKLTSTLSYKDMIFGIIYCLSYSQDRIHDFEISMIKELLNRGYKIIIALTNADNSGYETKKIAFREKLNKELNDYLQYFDTVDICAEAVQKLGQKTARRPFGKEELFKQLEKDIISNYSKVLVANIKTWYKRSKEKTNNFYSEQFKKIEKFYEFDFNSTLEKQAEEEANRLQEAVKNLIKEIFDKYNSAIKEAEDFYSRISGSYNNLKLPLWHIILLDSIPLVGFIILFFSRKSFAKKQLIESLNQSIKMINDEIDKALIFTKEFGEKLFQGKI
ncbi:MAG: GTPase domain-containing protein [Treponema sp.]|nr:GTPase domain-containing protein [Treponema sp.]MCL2250903.1 GTPase domain-containing protein [Treponema sp.]